VDRFFRQVLLAMAVTPFVLATGCNDLGVIPTVSYPDCDEIKDDIWLQLQQLDFGFFCNRCAEEVECRVGQSCGDGLCYDPADAEDPCAPNLDSATRKVLLHERRIELLAPLYSCRMDEEVDGYCPPEVQARAVEKLLELLTGDDCNPCDELAWMLCRCQFDPNVAPQDNLMLQCLVADGGRKSNPLWSGYTEGQEFDCVGTKNDFRCDEFFFPE